MQSFVPEEKKALFISIHRRKNPTIVSRYHLLVNWSSPHPFSNSCSNSVCLCTRICPNVSPLSVYETHRHMSANARVITILAGDDGCEISRNAVPINNSRGPKLAAAKWCEGQTALSTSSSSHFTTRQACACTSQVLVNSYRSLLFTPDVALKPSWSGDSLRLKKKLCN